MQLSDQGRTVSERLRPTRRVSPRACGAALGLTLALILGSVAYASIPDNSGTIHGCYMKSGGALSVIDSSTGKCSSNQTALNWNQVGPQGPQGPQGPVGMIWRGDWNATSTYQISDAVADGGSSWIARAINTNSEPSLANPVWSVLAQRGNDGAQGTQGPQGPLGPQGPQGPEGPAGTSDVYVARSDGDTDFGDGVDLVHVTVPAGSYLIDGKVVGSTEDSDTQTITCSLTTGDTSQADVDFDRHEVITLLDAATFAADNNTINLHCGGFDSFATHVVLTATKVTTIH